MDGDFDTGYIIATEAPRQADLAEVWDGQYDPDHPVKSFVTDKVGRGAVTVANLKGRVYDGTVDIDLIRVALKKPDVAYFEFFVQIAITGDGAKTKIWKDNQKLEEETQRTFSVEDFGEDTEKIIWIEGLDKSTSVRDNELKIISGDKFDIIKLTFVWATCARNAGEVWYKGPGAQGYNAQHDGAIPPDLANNTNTDPQNGGHPENQSAKDLVAFINNRLTNNGSGTPFGYGFYYDHGMSDFRMAGRILLEFTVYPIDIYKIKGVVFDIAQQKHSRLYLMDSGANTWGLIEGVDFPNATDGLDKPNDPTSVAPVPTGDNHGHIYIYDDPGVGFTASYALAFCV